MLVLRAMAGSFGKFLSRFLESVLPINPSPFNSQLVFKPVRWEGGSGRRPSGSAPTGLGMIGAGCGSSTTGV